MMKVSQKAQVGFFEQIAPVDNLDRNGNPMRISIEQAEQIRGELLRWNFPLEACNEVRRALSRHTRKEWEFVMINPHELVEATQLMLKMARPKTALSVYNVMLGSLEFNSSLCKLDQSDICELVGVSRANVSPVMARMSEKGLIASTGRCGGAKKWHLSPSACWRGAEPERRDAIKTFREKLAQNEVEAKARRLRHPGPRSRADRELDASVIDMQTRRDESNREAAIRNGQTEMM